MLCYLLSVPFCVFIEKQIRHNTEHINNNNILIFSNYRKKYLIVLQK